MADQVSSINGWNGGAAGGGPQLIQPSRSKLILTLARRYETDRAGSRSLMRRGVVDIR